MIYELINFHEEKIKLSKYKNDLIEIDNGFQPIFRLEWSDMKYFIENWTDICLFIKIGKHIVGEAYGCTLETKEEVEWNDPHYGHWIDLINMYKDKKVLYFYSFAIHSIYQGKGLGKILIKNFLKECKTKGYDIVISHAKEGSSSHLHEKLGGKILTYKDNWYNTGDKHYLHEFKLI